MTAPPSASLNLSSRSATVSLLEGSVACSSGTANCVGSASAWVGSPNGLSLAAVNCGDGSKLAMKLPTPLVVAVGPLPCIGAPAEVSTTPCAADGAAEKRTAATQQAAIRTCTQHPSR